MICIKRPQSDTNRVNRGVSRRSDGNSRHPLPRPGSGRIGRSFIGSGSSSPWMCPDVETIAGRGQCPDCAGLHPAREYQCCRGSHERGKRRRELVANDLRGQQGSGFDRDDCSDHAGSLYTGLRGLVLVASRRPLGPPVFGL